MNILYICDEYPPGKNGGIGTAVQLLARQMVQLGHSVWVVGLYASSYGGLNEEVDNGVKIHRLRYGLNFKNESIFFKAYRKLPGIIKSNLNGESAYKKFIDFIHSLIEEQKIDIIEMPDWHTFAMHIGFVVRWPAFKAPVLLKAHGCYTKICNDTGQQAEKQYLLNDQLLYNRADAICAVSHHTAEEVKKLFGIEKKIKVLYNGIELVNKVKEVSRKNNQIIFTGSLTKQKGIYQLIKAWNEVIEKRPDLRLVVYGKGKTKPLIDLLNNKAVDTVEFKGHVDRTEIFKALSSASFAVLPSYTETFGLTAIEAMSAGCPVIFTKLSSGKEIVENGENGYLVNPDDLKEMVDLILNLAGNETMREKFSRNGRQTVELKFDIRTIATEHVAYYKETIEAFVK